MLKIGTARPPNTLTIMGQVGIAAAKIGGSIGMKTGGGSPSGRFSGAASAASTDMDEAT